MSGTQAAVVPVVTVDGPVGAGKGTVGQALAGRLGWHYLDSGALYRVLALAAERAGCPEDPEALAGLAEGLEIRTEARQVGLVRVWLGGEDVSDAIRREECGQRASRIAALGAVRDALRGLQRRAREAPGLVADGRDMGTVVFPDAVLKVFLTASVAERARRRHNQLKEKGFDANLHDLFQTIRERDVRDMERAESPLLPAEGAEILDTSSLTVGEVVERIQAMLAQRGVVAQGLGDG